MTFEITKEEVEACLVRMRELAKSPQKRAEMEAAWGGVCGQLEPYYRAMRPLPRSFEVHHMNETARARFAHAIAAGHPFAECARLAVARIIDK